MKKTLSFFAILCLGSLQAQLKIGSNPSLIINEAMLQINGTATRTSIDPDTFIYDKGKVGIGTTKPDGQLDILSPNTLGTSVILSNYSTNGHKYVFTSEGSGSPLVGSYTIFDATQSANRLTISSNGYVGIATGYSAPTSMLQVNGEIEATAIKGPSDVRYKKNIKPLEGSLDKITKLKGYNYEWKKDEFPKKNFKGGTDIGLIAQEVEKVYPEVVYTANDEMQSKSIDYSKLVPALIESIKELKAEIETLKSQMPYQKR